MSNYRFVPALNGYDVFLKTSGRRLGFVYKWERRYNLRRVIVSKGWRATTADDRKLYRADGYTSESREGAATSLMANWESTRYWRVPRSGI